MNKNELLSFMIAISAVFLSRKIVTIDTELQYPYIARDIASRYLMQ